MTDTTETRIGYWYATGPADRPFHRDDAAWNMHRVVADICEHSGCVLVENAAGQRFPLGRDLLDKIARPPGWDAVEA